MSAAIEAGEYSPDAVAAEHKSAIRRAAERVRFCGIVTYLLSLP